MGTCGSDAATITDSVNATRIDISQDNEDNEDMNETTETDKFFNINEIKVYKVTEKDLKSSIYSKFMW